MKRILLPLLLALCLLLTGCGGSTQAAAYTDDAIMARKGDWYTMNDWQHSLSDNTLNCSMKGSTGTLTVWSMEATADTPVTIDCTLTVTAGRAKLAHIAPDGTVTTLLEVSPDSPVTTSTLRFTALPRENRVKLVMAESTSLDMALSFDQGTLRNEPTAHDKPRRLSDEKYTDDHPLHSVRHCAGSGRGMPGSLPRLEQRAG